MIDFFSGLVSNKIPITYTEINKEDNFIFENTITIGYVCTNNVLKFIEDMKAIFAEVKP